MPAGTELAVYDELCAYTLSRRDPAFAHQHVVDCWALQHATSETKPIAMVFALMDLYLHLEHGYTGKQIQLAHMKLAKQRKDWPRFTPPTVPVTFSVSEIMRAEGDAARDQAIERWCVTMWDSWKDSHEAIRQLMQQELGVVPHVPRETGSSKTKP